MVLPSIHQSRSRVLRLTAARTLVKTARVITAMRLYALRSLCNVLFPPTDPQGADGPIGGRVIPRQLLCYILLSSCGLLEDGDYTLLERFILIIQRGIGSCSWQLIISLNGLKQYHSNI